MLLFLLVPLTAAIVTEFDNVLTGSPKVLCERDSISLEIPASHGAPSVVFAKGHFNKEGCSFRNETHVTFDFDKCNIRRKREVQPRGMAYTMTVVVQLHPLFITKVDRAYSVRCFYMEAEKSVGALFNVSELTTVKVEEEHVQPSCSYSLHRDSPHGALLRYAHVGDIVYHVWDCPSDVYSMLIHSCVVQDGQGQEQKVIDEQGCSTDLYLMPELVYAQDLTRTFTASNAFNFPDVTSVQFSCQIKLCFRGNGGCDSLTPPNCGRAGARDEKIEEVVKSEKAEEWTKNDRKEEPTDDSLLSSPSPIPDLIFGSIIDQSTSTVATAFPSSPSTTTTLSPSTTTTTTTTRTATSSSSTTLPSSTIDQSFPTPKTLRQYIQDKYTNTEEGSGFEEELNEREKKRELKRRDTDTVDLDISSPELTVLDKDELGKWTFCREGKDDSDDKLSHTLEPSSLSSSHSSLSSTPSVCVPLTAFWLLVALVLLSSSFLFLVICKSTSKQGFVQF